MQHEELQAPISANVNPPGLDGDDDYMSPIVFVLICEESCGARHRRLADLHERKVQLLDQGGAVFTRGPCAQSELAGRSGRGRVKAGRLIRDSTVLGYGRVPYLR